MSIFIWIIVVMLLIPVFMVVLECVAALFPRRREEPSGRRPRLAILIPAHDEAAVIADTLASVMPQLQEDDNLLVVADNCMDETAAIASKVGAKVLERHDDENRGKGFALASGIDTLRSNPPEVLVMIDADCIIGNGAIDILARTALDLDAPVQALYLMHAGMDAPLRLKIASFAWIVKTWVRALGLSRLGMPCQLMGTGMAFPWHVIKDADLGSDAIVEDLLLGLQLAMQGHKAHFCPDICVTSKFPVNESDEGTQRRRWEHGHLAMILLYLPKLLLAAMRKRDIGLLALGLDLMVPPLALQSLLLLAGLTMTAITTLFGMRAPFIVLLSGSLLFGLSIFAVWYGFAREVIGFRELLGVPAYILSKLSVYSSFIFSRESKWIRTGRGGDDEKGN